MVSGSLLDYGMAKAQCDPARQLEETSGPESAADLRRESVSGRSMGELTWRRSAAAARRDRCRRTAIRHSQLQSVCILDSIRAGDGWRRRQLDYGDADCQWSRQTLLGMRPPGNAANASAADGMPRLWDIATTVVGVPLAAVADTLPADVAADQKECATEGAGGISGSDSCADKDTGKAEKAMEESSQTMAPVQTSARRDSEKKPLMWPTWLQPPELARVAGASRQAANAAAEVLQFGVAGVLAQLMADDASGLDVNFDYHDDAGYGDGRDGDLEEYGLGACRGSRIRASTGPTP
mmetsp:Transcript_119765/g.350222  ORF Transcript_119765/g.350222 Transcript_119765/m.350222 type:complete len:295 (-) Transcript_119765:86-970(-)